MSKSTIIHLSTSIVIMFMIAALAVMAAELHGANVDLDHANWKADHYETAYKKSKSHANRAASVAEACVAKLAVCATK